MHDSRQRQGRPALRDVSSVGDYRAQPPVHRCGRTVAWGLLGGACLRSLLVWTMALEAITLATGAQMDDDVSASYDYDGTLMLDSRNFRGMTSQGVWVVMFYSYSVVIKSTEEAQNCQRFTWLWGDLANRFSKMGGETHGGLSLLAPCLRLQIIPPLSQFAPCIYKGRFVETP